MSEYFFRALMIHRLIEMLTFEQESSYKSMKMRTGGCVLCHRRTPLYRMPFCGRCLDYVEAERKLWPEWLVFLVRYKIRELTRLIDFTKEVRETPFCEFEQNET